MNTENSKPITHWILQRSTAIFILFTLFLAPIWFILPVLTILVFWHLYLGLEEILADYVHSELTGKLQLTFLKILIFITIKYVFVLFVF